jgi:hypothetical protein
MDNQGNYQNNQPPQYSQQPQQQPPQYPQQPSYAGQVPGKGKAIASLVLGIIAIVLPIPILCVIAGIIGIVLASLAKKEGFTGGIRTAGFVCSIIGAVGGVIWTIVFFAGLVLFVSFIETVVWQNFPVGW